MAEELTERLASAFIFDAADLSANARGQISIKQLEILAMRRKALWLGFGLFSAAMAMTAMFVVWMGRDSAEHDAAGFELGQSVISIICAAIVLSFTPFFIRRLHSLHPGGIKTAIGRAEVATNGPYLTVDVASSVRFRFPQAEPFLSAFSPGHNYLIYYLPGPQPVLLSGRAESEGMSFEGQVEHPGKALLQAAPLILILILAASFGIPVLLIELQRLESRLGIAGDAVWLANLSAGLVLCIIYLNFVARILGNCRTKRGTTPSPEGAFSSD